MGIGATFFWEEEKDHTENGRDWSMGREKDDRTEWGGFIRNRENKPYAEVNFEFSICMEG